MADSVDVLGTLKFVYTLYALAVISIIAYYAYRITQNDDNSSFDIKPKVFWGYVATLVTIGTGLHFLTYNVVPWVPMDLDRANIKAEKTFKIHYKDHQMILDEKPMKVECNKYVVFDAYSDDLTYGFGIFRQDNTLVAQMQVVPGNGNDLMWRFPKNGTYYIKSTEYSGPKGVKMRIDDAIVVTGCEKDDPRSMK